MNRNHGKTAFTLVELLVVISIIGVLIGLLLPALSSAVEMARTVECKSNLRQLFLAAKIYTKDSGGYYPQAWVILKPNSIAWCGGYHSGGGTTTMDVTESPLWPYLQDKQVMRCPSYSPAQVKYTASGEISGYGINCQYVAGDPVTRPGDDGMTPYARPAPVTQIKHPGRTILFADSARIKNGIVTEEFFVYALYKPGSAAKNSATIHFRHAGCANAAFCDGHVESIDPLQLDPAGDGRCGWVSNDLMDRN